jgi:hypothetical protein
MQKSALFSVVAAIVAASPLAAAQQKLVAVNEAALSPTPGAAAEARRDAPEADLPPAAPAPQPYVSPSIGRSVSPGTGVRFDTTTAPFQANGQTSVASAFFLSGSYKINDAAGVNVRTGFDRVGQPGMADKVGFLNVSLGGMYSWKLGRPFRLATSLGVWLPVGSGGGNSGDQDLVAAHKATSLARSAMEGATFSVNDFTIQPAVDFAYVDHGLTVQLGVAVSAAIRARGEEQQKDALKSNSTWGLSLGYFLLPQLSLGAELRYQRYLSTPSSVEKDPTTRQNLSAAGGVRGHVKLAQNVTLRPGVSYAHGLAGPVEKNGYHIVQLDIPVSF